MRTLAARRGHATTPGGIVLTAVLCGLAPGTPVSGEAPAGPLRISPDDDGAAGDGKRDDAVPMAKAVAALRGIAGPRVLAFGAGRVYRLAEGDREI